MRIIEAFKAFFETLFGKPKKSDQELKTPSQKKEQVQQQISEKKQEKNISVSTKDLFAEGAIWTLAMLQREGRLVDFLQENIDDYDDEQVGAAVRQIHKSCGKALAEHFGISRIADSQEGAEFVLRQDYSPTEYKIIGNPPTAQPLKGILVHKGWRATALNLPELTGTGTKNVIQQAEISFEERNA